MRRNSLMTLKHNDLHLHALHKLSPALPTPAKRKSFLEKRKGQSCNSLPMSGIFCEVFSSKHLDLRWAHIHDSSTEHFFTRTSSVITSKQNIKHPDVTGDDHPYKLDVSRLEIGESELHCFFLLLASHSTLSYAWSLVLLWPLHNLIQLTKAMKNQPSKRLNSFPPV